MNRLQPGEKSWFASITEGSEENTSEKANSSSPRPRVLDAASALLTEATRPSNGGDGFGDVGANDAGDDIGDVGANDSGRDVGNVGANDGGGDVADGVAADVPDEDVASGIVGETKAQIIAKLRQLTEDQAITIAGLQSRNQYLETELVKYQGAPQTPRQTTPAPKAARSRVGGSHQKPTQSSAAKAKRKAVTFSNKDLVQTFVPAYEEMHTGLLRPVASILVDHEQNDLLRVGMKCKSKEELMHRQYELAMLARCNFYTLRSKDGVARYTSVPRHAQKAAKNAWYVVKGEQHYYLHATAKKVEDANGKLQEQYVVEELLMFEQTPQAFPQNNQNTFMYGAAHFEALARDVIKDKNWHKGAILKAIHERIQLCLGVDRSDQRTSLQLVGKHYWAVVLKVVNTPDKKEYTV
jgi:hypothetical protein